MAEVKIRSDSSKRKRDQIMAVFNCAIGFVIIYIEEQLGDNLTWELATYTSGRRVEREFISLECTWWERNQSERRDWLESLSQLKTESGRFFIILLCNFLLLCLHCRCCICGLRHLTALGHPASPALPVSAPARPLLFLI